MASCFKSWWPMEAKKDDDQQSGRPCFSSNTGCVLGTAAGGCQLPVFLTAKWKAVS